MVKEIAVTSEYEQRDLPGYTREIVVRVTCVT
jgi:hypothetical protein